MKTKYFAILIVFISAGMVTPLQAALIQGPGFISASTSIGTCDVSICLGYGTDINQIADGDNSNFNGFAGADGEIGTITLDLLGTFDLGSFSLWNDINVFHEGVGTFKLHFFDELDGLIESTGILTAPDGQFDAEIYLFDHIVEGVSKVELETLTLLTGGVCCRIEIREVAFEGEFSATKVFEPKSIGLFMTGIIVLVATKSRKHQRSNLSI